MQFKRVFVSNSFTARNLFLPMPKKPRCKGHEIAWRRRSDWDSRRSDRDNCSVYADAQTSSTPFALTLGHDFGQLQSRGFRHQETLRIHFKFSHQSSSDLHETALASLANEINSRLRQTRVWVEMTHLMLEYNWANIAVIVLLTIAPIWALAQLFL